MIHSMTKDKLTTDELIEIATRTARAQVLLEETEAALGALVACYGKFRCGNQQTQISRIRGLIVEAQQNLFHS